MQATRLVGIAVRSIRKNQMRTLLTMLGIIIGVGAVIVMVAVGEGATSQIRSRIDALGTNLVVITPGATNAGGVSLGAGTGNRLTLDDYDALSRESRLLTAISPVIATPAQAVGGQGNWRTMVSGVSVDYAAIRDWSVASGRFFEQADVAAMRKVAVIGRTVADGLFPGEDPVGSTIRLRRVPFEVIGVLEEKGQNAEGGDLDDVVLAPYTTVKTRLAGRTFIPQILGSAAREEDIPGAQAEIRGVLRETHGLADSDGDDFTVRNQNDLAEAAQSTTEVMTLLLAAIASISLLVGGIGIMNIMLVSVTERTREIGIRLAIGARGSDVLTQFLVESVVMSVIGGALGLLAGVAGAAVLRSLTGWGASVSPIMVAIAMGFSGLVGVFFGLYPARKAAALDPIEALRYE
jgi:putative ABC transport system permease protein